MEDLYLQELLKGNISAMGTSSATKVKNLLEIEIEKEIDTYIKEAISDIPTENRFLTPAMQKARLREELKKECRQEELSHYLDDAFKSIEMENQKSPFEKEHSDILEDFYTKLGTLEKITIPQGSSPSFKTLLSISNSTEEFILSLAEKRSTETGFASSLPLYILLAILDPGNPTYWYRAAIACHTNNDYKIAIRFYNASLFIDPQLVGAKLFAADCYSECDLHEEAVQSLKEAETMNETEDFEKVWRPLMMHLSNKLNV